MKTRSSSGVGQKVDLEFNIDTLRITDLEEEEESSLGNMKASSAANSVINSLKRTSVVSTSSVDSETGEIRSPVEGSNLPKIRAQTQAPMIRNILNNLNPEKD